MTLALSTFGRICGVKTQFHFHRSLSDQISDQICILRGDRASWNFRRIVLRNLSVQYAEADNRRRRLNESNTRQRPVAPLRSGRHFDKQPLRHTLRCHDLPRPFVCRTDN